MGRRVLALLANIVFARLLDPADFGLVAMAGVVLGFIDIFKDLGTGTALVRQKELGDSLPSSVFWLNLGFGTFITLLVMALSPGIAAFYKEPGVQPVVMAMALSFVLSSLAIVHSSMLARQMRFDRLAKVELAAALMSYAVGIGAALMGKGVWSLVWQVLANSALTALFVWMISSWRPRLVFAWKEVRAIMAYSLNLSGFNIFFYFAQNVDNLLIGRFLGTEALGLYDLAYKLMLFPMQAISAVFGRVMTPLYAQAQTDLPRFRQVFVRVAVAIAFVTFPLMLGLVAAREAFVLTVFGASWTPVITLLALFAPLAAIRSVQTTTGSIYVAMGRADLQLRWGVASNLIVCAGLAIGLHWGIVGVASGFALASLLLLYPNFTIPFRLIGLHLTDLLHALRPTALCAALMFICTWALGLMASPWLGHTGMLALQVGAGVLSYVLFTAMFNRAMLREFLAGIGLPMPAPMGKLSKN
jgi:PST family polysaccharide transporter